MPVALSFAPGPVPVSSRCAITTIACGDWPRATAHTLRRVARPSPGTCSCHASVASGSPYGAIWSRNQRAARTELGPVGDRSGYEVAKSVASCRAAAPSKFGGRIGGGSGLVRTMLKARMRSGSEQKSSELR